MARFEVHGVKCVTVKTCDFPYRVPEGAFRTIDLHIEGENGEDTVILFTKDMSLALPKEMEEL